MALDYHFETGMLFWSDFDDGCIYKAPIDEGQARSAISPIHLPFIYHSFLNEILPAHCGLIDALHYIESGPQMSLISLDQPCTLLVLLPALEKGDLISVNVCLSVCLSVREAIIVRDSMK